MIQESAQEKPRYEHSVARVQPGQEIRFSPVITQAIESYLIVIGGDLVDIKPIEVENIGAGQIRVLKRRLDLDEDAYYKPAGPVEPISFEIEIDDLTPEIAAETRCDILYKGKRFEGEPVYDEDDAKVEGSETLYFWHFYPEGDSQKRAGYVLFPPTTKFDEVGFVIDRK